MPPLFFWGQVLVQWKIGALMGRQTWDHRLRSNNLDFLTQNFILNKKKLCWDLNRLNWTVLKCNYTWLHSILTTLNWISRYRPKVSNDLGNLWDLVRYSLSKTKIIAHTFFEVQIWWMPVDTVKSNTSLTNPTIQYNLKPTN